VRGFGLRVAGLEKKKRHSSVAEELVPEELAAWTLVAIDSTRAFRLFTIFFLLKCLLLTDILFVTHTHNDIT